MTPHQAQAIYALSAEPQWQKLTEYWQSEIGRLHESLETCSPESLRKIQGEIISLKECLKLREIAESILKVDE